MMGRNYTPGEVAEILKVTPNTVLRWCDKRKLTSFLLPHPRHKIRRIPHDALRLFMREHGLSTDELDAANYVREKLAEPMIDPLP